MFFLFDKHCILDDFDLHQKVTSVLEDSHEAQSLLLGILYYSHLTKYKIDYF
jgi:hypothetical protein